MTLIELATYVILPTLAIAILLVLVRFGSGPTVTDRVIALDLLTTLGIGVSTVYAIATDQQVFLDVAIVLALISFLGTVAFAYYLEKRD